MSRVPNDPESFFSAYIPALFAELEGLAGASSPGSVVFRVPGAGEWAFRLVSGALIRESNSPADTVVCITIPESSFVPLVVRGSERLAELQSSPEKQMLAFRALTIDAERASMIRGVVGTLAFAVVDAEAAHRVFVTPGKHPPNLEKPECEVSCDADAFWNLQSGTANPLELLMSGKLRITGDAQIPIALSSLFV